ncbi:MAG: response regulator transcription factor [Jaaginema sp. PMC 1079.18]|nr:response regulator transcription factor [Jaaginema sp. PMC 1080.18]MEC4853410.1 response regulator transcription factor [Jaaginema sp. PMC 1079.18]MEC4867611.1 response regulator transcription factor [Jaaginema sp. PMC 1078.18]
MIATQVVSILLVDDDPKFREGLRTLFSFYSHSGSWRYEIVGEAATVDQAVKLAHQQRPSLVVLDLELPQKDGIAALHKLRESSPSAKVLVLSGHHQDEWIFRAMQAGAKGYLFKEQLVNQLCQAITTIINNEIYLAPEVTTRFFRMFHFYNGRSFSECKSFSLTEREREVLYWLVQGLSNEEISQHLYVTVATVKAHLTAIFEKLKVTSRTQAIIKALKLGLVSVNLSAMGSSTS